MMSQPPPSLIPTHPVLTSRIIPLLLCSHSLFALIGVAVMEVARSTYTTGLSRKSSLMGFAAVPNTLADDTHINSIGFTGDVVDVATPRDTIRILTLGGSAMFNPRMTQRLKARLSAASSASHRNHRWCAFSRNAYDRRQHPEVQAAWEGPLFVWGCMPLERRRH